MRHQTAGTSDSRSHAGTVAEFRGIFTSGGWANQTRPLSASFPSCPLACSVSSARKLLKKFSNIAAEAEVEFRML